MHLLVVALFAGRGRTLVPAQFSFFLLGLLVYDVGCLCLLVHTWCHAAWGQGCCMKSFLFASLLRAWCRGGGSSIGGPHARNAGSPASPRPPESERAVKQDSQGFMCTLQIEKRYLKTGGSFVSSIQPPMRGL